MGFAQHSKRDEVIEEYLTPHQEWSIEAAVEQLQLEQKIMTIDVSKAFDLICFCILQRHLFAECGDAFRKKLLAIQHKIRRRGFAWLQREVEPKLLQSAA